MGRVDCKERWAGRLPLRRAQPEEKGEIMYQCCIFDLDGTLVNSVYAIQKAVNGTLEHFGLVSRRDMGA